MIIKFKIFEATKDYEWENIYTKDDNLCVDVYNLASEMQRTVEDLGKKYVTRKEDEYRHLIKSLLIGKVISFECSDCDASTHTGICDDVEFHGGFQEEPDNHFQFNYIEIKTEDMDEAHSIDDDTIIIHNYDPELYKQSKKYNI